MDKLKKLKDYLENKKSLAIAFSGGVDSTFLLYYAHEVLGENALAITIDGATLARSEMEEAKAFCKSKGIRQIVISVDEFSVEDFKYNAPSRCYSCKKNIFTKVKDAAKKNGIEFVADGSNVDDKGDFRPGMKALKELGIISPLMELGFSKKEIRAYSREYGLPTWEKPALACLATRIPYGEEITKDKLSMIERAEGYLRSLGFVNVRVRSQEKSARIEVDSQDIDRFLAAKMRASVVKELKSIGYTYVSLDLLGFRSGSMNESLNLPDA